MVTFVVETYLSGDADGEPDATIARATDAAAGVAAAGQRVRYLRSIFIPDDETCLLLFEAETPDQVDAVIEQAGLDPDRVSRAVIRISRFPRATSSPASGAARGRPGPASARTRTHRSPR